MIAGFQLRRHALNASRFIIVLYDQRWKLIGVVYGTTFKVCGAVKMEANMHLYTPKMLEIIVQGLESCLFSDQMFAVFLFNRG